jgi:hypothetical protein
MASTLEVWIDSVLAKKTGSYGCRGKSRKEKTESGIIAAQDQAMQSKYHAT